ncbi:MAG: hypothetical protein EA374_07845 [Acholeplasmatales bacterium]|nr:MAG: hypothetical protein EA374_07845 [Acholeplasmatales bacterium]
MTNHDIRTKIIEAAHADVPDLRAAIKSSSRFQVNVRPTFWTQLRLRPLQFASLLLVFGVALSLWLTSPAPILSEVYATIYLDINPSFEIDIDARYDIIEVRPMNPDALSVMRDLATLTGQPFDDALDRLVEQAVALEYLTAERPVMMMDVSTRDIESREHLLTRVTEKVPELREKHLPNIDIVEGDAREQTSEETDTAIHHDMSVMRLRMIREIMRLDEGQQFEALARLDAGELSRLLEVLRKRTDEHDSINPGERPSDDDPTGIRPPQEGSQEKEDDAPTTDSGMGS